MKCDKACLVVQYMKTGEYVSGTYMSDNSMIFTPGVQHYVREVTYTTVKKPHPSPNELDHYVSIVARVDAVQSMRIDGSSVSGSQVWTPVDAWPEYKHTTMSITDGLHQIQADGAFAAWIFGHRTKTGYGSMVTMGISK